MITPLYASYALIATLAQLCVIWAMRSYGWSFIALIPLVFLHQYLFTTAYAKAPNFVAQWFFTMALTGTAAYLMGVLVFGDRLAFVHLAGVLLIVCGIVLLKVA
jgi:multidrug transporter EmrE-like cation transporter